MLPRDCLNGMISAPQYHVFCVADKMRVKTTSIERGNISCPNRDMVKSLSKHWIKIGTIPKSFWYICICTYLSLVVYEASCNLWNDNDCFILKMAVYVDAATDSHSDSCCFVLLWYRWIFYILYLCTSNNQTTWMNIYINGWNEVTKKTMMKSRQSKAQQNDDVIKRKYFPVTGPLGGEFTGHRWIPPTNASDAELWCLFWSTSEETAE